MLEVLRFWLEMGIDGFRVDAVPYLYEREGTNCENLPETFAFLEDLRRHVDRRFKDKVLLAVERHGLPTLGAEIGGQPLGGEALGVQRIAIAGQALYPENGLSRPLKKPSNKSSISPCSRAKSPLCPLLNLTSVITTPPFFFFSLVLFHFS